MLCGAVASKRPKEIVARNRAKRDAAPEADPNGSSQTNRIICQT